MHLNRPAAPRLLPALALLGALAPAVPAQADVEYLAVGPASLVAIEAPAEPTVHGRLAFAAGSLRDPAPLAGLAELAAGALRRGGCEAFTGAELDAWLADQGAGLAIETTTDHLTVTFRCEAEDLEGLLERLGDLLTAPAFEGLDAVRDELLERLTRDAEDPAAIADRAMTRLLHGAYSPHGRAATPLTLGAVTAADLEAWAAGSLSLDRATFGMAGTFDAEEAAGWLAEAFEDLPESGPAPEVVRLGFWSPEHTRIFVIDRPDAAHTELRLAAPGVRWDSPDHAALELWSQVLGGPGGRLTSRLVTELDLTGSIDCRFAPGFLRPGRLDARLATSHDAVGRALSELFDGITETLADPLLGAEVEGALERALIAHSPIDASGEIALERAMALTVHGYPADFWQTDHARLTGLDSQDLLEAARRHIAPARFLVVAVGPAEEIMDHLEAVAEVSPLEPEQPLEPADDTVAAMLEALGGAEAWARCTAIEVEQTAEIAFADGSLARIPVEMQRSFDPVAIRLKQTTPAGAVYVNVITEEGGQLKTPTGRAEVPAEALRTWQSLQRRWLYYNLHRLATGDEGLHAGLDSDGRLVLIGTAGQLAWIELDEADRPVRMGSLMDGAETLYEYFDWTETDAGVLYSARFIEDGNQTVVVGKFEPVAEFSESTWQL